MIIQLIKQNNCKPKYSNKIIQSRRPLKNKKIPLKLNDKLRSSQQTELELLIAPSDRETEHVIVAWKPAKPSTYVTNDW